MAYVTQRFTGPNKVSVTMDGRKGTLVFKLKDDTSYLDIVKGNIVSYKGVTPQPFQLKQVVRIRTAEYTEPLAVKTSNEQVEDIVKEIKAIAAQH